MLGVPGGTAGWPRGGAHWLLVVACLAVAAPGEGQASDGAWMVGADAGLDLWYHGLALAGLQGSSGEVLYDPGYPAAIATRQIPNMKNGARNPTNSTMAGANRMKPTSMMFANGTTVAWYVVDLWMRGRHKM